jgi:hypothetical protein
MAGRKLKVFQAQFGFYDTVVAAPSRAAALRAWGTRQDLFASGGPGDPPERAAPPPATAQPETPLRRAVGSTDPFALEPTSLPKVPDAPKKAAVKPVVKAKPNAPAKPPADRSKLDAAEKALRALDDGRKAEEADLRREEDELEARREASQAAYVEARKAAAGKVVDARSEYRKAGGED